MFWKSKELELPTDILYTFSKDLYPYLLRMLSQLQKLYNFVIKIVPPPKKREKRASLVLKGITFSCTLKVY